MNIENHYESPEIDDDRDLLKHRRLRRNLVYLKRMHDDPAAYRRRLSFRGYFYFALAVVALLLLQFQEETSIGLLGLVFLVIFSMFIFMPLL